MIVLFILFLFHCSIPIQKQYSKAIAKESFFLRDSNPINNLALNQIQNHLLDESEKNLKKSIQEGSVISFLNLFRLYFILDEYDLARKLTKNYLKENSYSEIKIKKILSYFQTQKRVEEQIIFLDILFQNKNFQVFAGKKLGDYFLSTKKYRESFFYYDKVLSVYPLDQESRTAMMKIAHDLEQWEDLLKFVQTFEKTGENPPNLYYYGAKANYELGNYYKALEYIRLIPYNQKKGFFFFDLWEKTILSMHPTDDLQELEPYKQQIKNNNFLYNIPYEVRKEIAEKLILGMD